MPSRICPASHLAAAIGVLVACQALAQGTKADYERAATLHQLTRGKVVGERLEAVWSPDGERLWYRADGADDARQFDVVDTVNGERRPAFDHVAAAKAIHQALGVEVDADHLPIERFRVDERGGIVLITETAGKTCVLSVMGDTIAVADQDAPPPFQLKAMHPSDRRRSYGGREETSVLFINRTDAHVRLTWLDEAGRPHPYHTLAPGESREQHTYTGHAWLAQREADDAPLAVFVADNTPSVAMIDGPALRAEPRRSTQLAPDGRWEITYRDHNARLRDTQTNETLQLSSDGKAGDAYDGEAHWSPDSRHVVVYQTEAGEEHKVHLVESSPDGQLQPKLHTIDYLKPGDKIQHPRPRLFDIEQRRAVPIDDALFPEPWWLSEDHWSADGSRFFFIYNQRGHQVVRVISIDAATGEARIVAEEKSRAFVDYAHKLFAHHLEATDQLLWMSERDGWNHLYLINRKTGEVIRQLTSGPWVVRAVDRVDEENRQAWLRVMGVYPQQDPYYIHHARVDLDTGELTMLTEGDGTHRIDFSPDRRFYIDTYSRVDLPPVHELRRSSDGSLVCELARADASALLATGWRMPQPFVAKGRDGKTDIHGVIYRPTNYDPGKKYPVIEAIYGGPQGQDVPKSFHTFHGPQALAELGFITVQIDGMGTNWRSKAFHDVAWKNLKDGGFPDRIAWIRAAAAVEPAMDITRVGIYGGSAGGQNAMRAVLDYADFYKAASADCGCHDNRMDKVWWNELWMGYPVDDSYAASSNVADAHKLAGALQLMVGELDRNVDPASTMQVVDALIRADKDFELIVFPGGGHGAGSSPYGQRRMHDFFVRHLLGVEPRRE